MGRIIFDLNNGSTLGTMVPTVGAFAFLPPTLTGHGLYIIFNRQTNNRYIGKSSNLPNRFQKRLEAVGELGFSVYQLSRINVFWGRVTLFNTPPPGGVAAARSAPAGGYSGGASLWGSIDGTNIELERLLIRFIMTQFLGGYVTNNTWAAIGATYANPTANPITVRLNYGAVGAYAPGHQTSVWGVGQAW